MARSRTALPRPRRGRTTGSWRARPSTSTTPPSTLSSPRTMSSKGRSPTASPGKSWTSSRVRRRLRSRGATGVRSRDRTRDNGARGRWSSSTGSRWRRWMRVFRSRRWKCSSNPRGSWRHWRASWIQRRWREGRISSGRDVRFTLCFNSWWIIFKAD